MVPVAPTEEQMEAMSKEYTAYAKEGDL